MTKEELEKEAIKASDKKCVKGCSKYYRYGFQDGYITGAEPREKRIVDLESTNKKISDECHKLVDSLEKKQNEIAELKDYNNYLKRQRQGGIQKQYNKVSIIKQQKEQLTKAKGIIKDLLFIYYDPLTTESDVKHHHKILADSRQFLKDSEVEK